MKNFAIALLAAALATAWATPANAAEPTATYANCTQMWTKYPNGVTPAGGTHDANANAAEAAGFKRPTIVSERVYSKLISAKLFTRGYAYPSLLLCGRKAPLVAPQTPANFSVKAPYSSSDTTIVMVWQMPAGVYPPPEFDIYLNGALKQTEKTAGTPANGVYTYQPYVFGLTANTTYQAYVVARSSAGSSAPTPVVTFTTAPPPKTTYTLTYTAGCGSGNCDVIVDNSTGGEDWHSNVNGGSWTIEIPKTSRNIWSIYVADNTYSGSTSCSITVDGRTVKSASSTGGASAYCSWYAS